jgi:uncharacterized membrane protein YqjE
MSQSDRPLLADLKASLRSLTGELREMLRLRWELLRLEATSDLKNTRRLLIIWAAASVMILTALPLCAVALADVLADVWQIAHWGWLLIFAGSLLFVALSAAYLAWRRFRRRFLGLQETLEELNEDRVWLNEWLKKQCDEKDEG